MADIDIVKTNFTAGEVSPELLGRSDLKLYQNGAKTLENVFVQPTGGASRRPGLRYCGGMPETTGGRLVPFEYKGTTYMFALSHMSSMLLYDTGYYISTWGTLWTLSQLEQLSWLQGADELLLFHPEHQPRRLKYNGTAHSLENCVFDTGTTGRVYQPHYKFVTGVTIAASATTGTVTLTASAALFTAGHVGVRFRLNDKEVNITAVTSGTVATATVIETLTATAATSNWTEAAFSAVRGWPSCAVFHQSRLVLGGSRDLPHRLFMSKTGKHWNFDLGTGLDDEAIEFSILADQANAIRGLCSSRHLQIFTSNAEWMATGAPLTPGTLQLQRQTRIGSLMGRYVPPQDADGATYFINRDGNRVCEFFYSEVEGAYAATDLSIMARHMVKDAVDMAYDASNRMLHVVLADGTMSTLTVYRTEGVTAWTRQKTDGQFKAVRAIGKYIYALVLRSTGLMIERFEAGYFLDGGLNLSNPTPVVGWAGFAYMNGKTVSVVCNGVVYPSQVVTGGMVTPPVTSTKCDVGYPYTMTIEPLPPSQVNFAGSSRTRLTELKMRLYDTAALRLDSGQGPRNIPLTDIELPAPQTYWPRLTGDVSIRAYGWTSNIANPLWSIQDSTPLAFNLLSVNATMKVSQ